MMLHPHKKSKGELSAKLLALMTFDFDNNKIYVFTCYGKSDISYKKD